MPGRRLTRHERQVARPFWFDGDGAKHPGETVTLDVEALYLNEDRDTAVQMLRDILADLDADSDSQ